MKKLFLAICLLLQQFIGNAAISLPGIFGDGMVLQRDRPIHIWGWAARNEKITVSFHQQVKTVKATKEGSWELWLDAEPASTVNSTLTIQGKNLLVIREVLVGDVWLCSGQSNMEWPMSNVEHSKETIAASANPLIRHYYLPKAISDKPLAHTGISSWQSASPEVTGNFTAVGYFFAAALQAQLQVPIGLINSSWGGTDVETWTSREAFLSSETFRAQIQQIRTLNLDSMAAKRKQVLMDKVKQVQLRLPDPEQARKFKDPETPDANWPLMNLPGLWEAQQLAGFDGVLWLRRWVTIAKEDAGKEALLSLAKIDDSDDSYVNGTLVGSTHNRYADARRYTIPAGLLKEGPNLIAIRVEDTGGGGGLYGAAKELYLQLGLKTTDLTGPWKFQLEAVQEGAASVSPNSYPSLLYNAMINPIIPFAIKGAIWYQGENNAGRAMEYREAFPLMIRDWRNKWKLGDFPFYFVQLASFNATGGNSAKGSSWAELREAQALALQLPNTGMAVTIDIGNPTDIHPRNKLDVGKRLAALALRDTYQQQLVAEGPNFSGMEIKGKQLVLNFNQTGSGLLAKDKYGYLRGFELAGADQQFYYAQARIVNGKVVVEADQVPAPVAVRYGWADDAGECNLFNKEGFPAAPFRSDNWKMVTSGKHYTVTP